MIKDASEIKVADVYRLLVFRADSAAVLAGSTSADFDELAETVSARVARDMQMTLKEVFITPTRAPEPELSPA